MALCAKGRSSLKKFEYRRHFSDVEDDGDDYYADDDSLEGAMSDSEPEGFDDEPEQVEEESPPAVAAKHPKRRRVEGSPAEGNSGANRDVGSGKETPRQPRPTKSLSAGHTLVPRSVSAKPKMLNMDSRKCDGKESLSTVLGNLTNMLGAVIGRLDQHESKLDSMERKLNTPSSSSTGSGSDNKRKVPTIVRTETRKVYKTLLDDDEFTGFDLSPETTLQGQCQPDCSQMPNKEVCISNPTFSAADIRGVVSSYCTYYTSLCQEEAQKRRDIHSQRKTQLRRCERVVRAAERDAQFQKMSFSEADRVKWRKVLVTEFMSSDESGEEDGKAVFIVKKLPWRSERVSNFLERLDTARASRKTEQASCQTKPRVYKDLISSRPPPCGFQSWAVIQP